MLFRSLIARECYAGGLLAKSPAALNLDAIIPDEAERAAKRDEILSYARIAEQSGRSLAELALQFVLGIEGVSITLVGIRTQAQLVGTLRHLAAPALTDAERQAIRAQWVAILSAKS